MQKPTVIGHRGASGYRPEHTLAAYRLALEQGADALEPDLVMTRDGVLVARHENELGGTTDVARHARFASRRTTKVIDAVAVTGWFTEDFTLEELKGLRARERIPDLRPDNCRFDGRFEIATLEEILSLREEVGRGRLARALSLGLPPPAPIGLYPEIKHPSYFATLGLPMAEPLIETLERHGCRGPEAGVFLQSFEPSILRALSLLTRLPRVQLIEAEGVPADLIDSGDPRAFADLLTPQGLAEVAAYASAIGPEKSLVVARDVRGGLAGPTALVADAHAQGLRVNPWTFRAENAFLPAELRSSAKDADRGDLASELGCFLAAGIDGFFTDQPDIGVRARDAFLEACRSRGRP
jgi:glycerophosphoryl diester phosphodiesterase